MLFYKIFLDSTFDSNVSMSNRPLLRGYLKTGATQLIKEGVPYIIAYIDEELFVRELFTGEYLNKAIFSGLNQPVEKDIMKFNDLSKFRVEPITKEELFSLVALKQNNDFIKVLQEVLFNNDYMFFFSTSEELAEDRAKQFDAYENGLTSINSYSKEYIENKALRYRR